MALRLLVFLLASSALASAQELTPRAPAPPAVGDRARVAWVESSTITASRTVRGQRAQSMTRETLLDAAWTEEVAAVETRAGALRASQVDLRVARWTRRDSGHDDPALTDRVVVLRPLLLGDARVELGPGPAASPAALAFFARVAERLLRSPLDDALRPDRAVKVGQTWRPGNAAELVFDAAFVDVDPEGTEAECKLRELGARADVRLTARLRLLTVPGTRARVEEGGDYLLEVLATFAPGERPSRGRTRERASFEGKARGQLPDGTPFDLATRARLETTIEVTRE